MNIEKLKQITHNNSKLIENFSYVTLLQVFILLAPLITYPYLVKVLGRELYGVILSAQMLASYASIIIDFGSNNVCAKHVSIARDDKGKLSEILSSVLYVRLLLFCSCFAIYLIVTLAVPIYREYLWLFILTYGLTFNDVLFPQFYFQGIENMKTITLINILTKLLFIVLVFVVVTTPGDYLFVPILYTVGYMLGGIISLYIIAKKHNIKFTRPTKSQALYYVKDSSPLFATELICTIKDKLNYMLVGAFVGMGEVVIYDLALKLHSLLTKPMGILTTVLLPRFAVTRNVNQLKKVILLSFVITTILVVLTNVFLPQISWFFLHEEIELLPIRIFLLAPIFVSVGSVISSNLFVAFGYNKYVFTSIIITTSVYVGVLACLLISHHLDSIYSFICLAVISYLTELIYRLYKASQIINFEISNGKIKHQQN